MERFRCLFGARWHNCAQGGQRIRRIISVCEGLQWTEWRDDWSIAELWAVAGNESTDSNKGDKLLNSVEESTLAAQGSEAAAAVSMALHASTVLMNIGAIQDGVNRFPEGSSLCQGA